tara:strand:- start:5220 stop:6998 length:1779 start_codon:yes stop_codon:yes gene_type:complete
MPPFSDNYQIKLITTGDEAGTWGDSTNDNLKRIEQALGQSTYIDITSPPSNSTWGGPTGSETPPVPAYTLQWLTTDTADAYADNSEGRSRFIEFGGNPGANSHIDIRGNSDTPGAADLVDRIYFIKNNLTSPYTISLNNNDTPDTNEYVIENGAFAVVATYSGSTLGTLTQDSVFNALSSLQIDNIIFPNDADITIKDGDANALTITTGTSAGRYLNVDSSTGHLELAVGSGVSNIDLHAATLSTHHQATDINIISGNATALTFTENSADAFLTLDTFADNINFGKDVSLGGEELNFTNVSGVDLNLLPATASALSVLEGVNEKIRINTVSDTLTVFDNQLDIVVETNNTVVLEGNTSLTVGGLLTVSGGISVDSGAIDNVNIGLVTPGQAKFTSLEATGGVTLEGSGTPGGLLAWENPSDATQSKGFWNNTGAGPVLFKPSYTSSGYGFIHSSNMTAATDGSTGYMEGVASLDDSAGGTGAVPSQAFVFPHAFTQIPSRIEWVLKCIDDSSAIDYSIGDEIPVMFGDANLMFRSWADSTNVGLSYKQEKDPSNNDLLEYEILVKDPNAGGIAVFYYKLDVQVWELRVKAWK